MAEDDLELRRREDARNRENRARLAWAFARFESEGLGGQVFEERVDFGLTFIEEPFIQTGHQVDLDLLADAQKLEPDDDELRIPQATSFVIDWDIDDRGFYVGAWCAGGVSLPPDVEIAIEANKLAHLVVVQHHLSFSAIALKDIPIDELRESDTIIS